MNEVETFFIGLKRKDLPKAFQFEDGLNDDNSFFENSSQIPWDINQPNDVTGNELCAYTNFGLGSNGRWSDFACGHSGTRAVCSRSCIKNSNATLVSECFNENFEVIFLNVMFRNLEPAREACSAINASLLRVNNLIEFNQVASFLTKLDLGITSIAFIGLQRLSFLDPLTFEYWANK